LFNIANQLVISLVKYKSIVGKIVPFRLHAKAMPPSNKKGAAGWRPLQTIQNI
jgi:hypothetical protein